MSSSNIVSPLSFSVSCSRLQAPYVLLFCCACCLASMRVAPSQARSVQRERAEKKKQQQPAKENKRTSRQAGRQAHPPPPPPLGESTKKSPSSLLPHFSCPPLPLHFLSPPLGESIRPPPPSPLRDPSYEPALVNQRLPLPTPSIPQARLGYRTKPKMRPEKTAPAAKRSLNAAHLRCSCGARDCALFLVVGT